jgi:hypothetical protein
MQTFLPYPDFVTSAKLLDYRRLGKQRLEAKQLINSIEKLKTDPNAKVGWANHPARQMWVGYEEALKLYHNCMVQEWINRGYNNTMAMYVVDYDNLKFPPWLGNPKLHASHRANLIRKDPVYYSQWTEDPTMEYYWPTRQNEASNG